jgi:putative hydrolase of the HAD superfamily
MTYAAVIFDLYGTLVGEWMGEEFNKNLIAMADALAVDDVEFRAEWQATSMERQTGQFESIEANVRIVCARISGVEPDPDLVRRALALRIDMYKRYFHPKEGAEPTLRELKARGFPLALISMCAPDTPELWRTSSLAPFVDVEVFSSESGLRKPHPEIYLKATGELGVDPARCLYIGDGAYGELSGAAGVGMDPVLIRHEDEPSHLVLRPEAEEWSGRRISSLDEVLEIAGVSAAGSGS